MTIISFKVKNEKIISFELKGHSKFDVYGKDIVCSSISTAVIMTLNGLLEVLKLVGIFYTVEEGYVNCDLSNLSMEELEKSSYLTDSMFYFLEDLEIKYPKHIKIIIKEV